jgi:hypothetical protein
MPTSPPVPGGVNGTPAFFINGHAVRRARFEKLKGDRRGDRAQKTK